MSWIHDRDVDGRHEGYVAHITRDGLKAVASTSSGLLMERPSRRRPAVVLPWSELFGWEARCACGWVGPLWRRLNLDDRYPDEQVEDAICDAWFVHVEEVLS